MMELEHDEEDRPASLSGVVDAILEIGRQRAAVLAEMKTALERGDNQQVLVLCRQLCGVTNGEESHRVN